MCSRHDMLNTEAQKRFKVVVLEAVVEITSGAWR